MAHSFRSNDIKVAAKVADIAHPKDDIGAIAYVIESIVKSCLNYEHSFDNDEDLTKWRGGLLAMPSPLMDDFWMRRNDVQHHLHNLVWTWATQHRATLQMRVAVEYFRLEGIAIWLSDKQLGFDRFFQELTQHLFHKMHYWVFEADEKTALELAGRDYFTHPKICYYISLPEDQRLEELKNIPKREALHFAPFDKFCEETGVGNAFHDYLETSHATMLPFSREADLLIKAAFVIRDQELQVAEHLSKAVQQESKKTALAEIWGLSDKGGQGTQTSTKKLVSEYIKSVMKKGSVKITSNHLKVSELRFPEFTKEDVKEFSLREMQVICDWITTQREIRPIDSEPVLVPRLITKKEYQQLEWVEEEILNRKDKFPKDTEAYEKLASQIIMFECKTRPFGLIEDNAALTGKTLTPEEIHELTKEKETDEVEIEEGSFANIKITKELVKVAGTPKANQSKTLKSSNDIVSKVTNCLDQIRDYHAKRKGATEPLRASHIAQFIKCNMTAEAPTLWTRIARENKETDNPEASKLKHKEAVYNRELKKPEDYLKGKTVPLSEAKRKADEWNSKREIKEEECWVEGPYKAHDILHPDVQAFIRAHFELGDSQKAKYKNGDEFEYYFPHGHSSAQVKVKPLVEDLCRLVDLGKEVDDWERYYKKTWEGKEIKSKKQEKKDAAAKPE
jgi:hypothetical protein